MNILFLGSGAFGLPALERLAREHTIVGVVTSPDKPSGRNRSLASTPIGAWASAQGFSLFKEENVNTPDFIEAIIALEPAAMVVIAFGQKLSEKFLEITQAVNLHASLLPRWRGAAPINAAILHGDTHSGLSVITLATQMDAGRVLGQISTPIGEQETAGELHDRLALLGPELMLEVLAGDFGGSEQNESEVTYAPKISRADARLDLTKSAVDVANTIRGYSPWPACHLHIAGVDCKIMRAIPKDGSGEIGKILEDGTIAVGEGSIQILELKPAGSKAMPWTDFCNGRSIQSGDVCGVSP
jgi:methionyl-tRNA formyltransferase